MRQRAVVQRVRLPGGGGGRLPQALHARGRDRLAGKEAGGSEGCGAHGTVRTQCGGLSHELRSVDSR